MTRNGLLARWAEAAFHAGRLREAAEAFEQALTGACTRGDIEKQARALSRLSMVVPAVGESRGRELVAEAVSLLERAGRDARRRLFRTRQRPVVAGAPAETIAAAERALSLAERQGLAVPTRALGFRGLARAYLGDADGLAEAEQALALMIEQGACRDAAVLQNNLAIARYQLQGPARSLAAFEEGIAFSEERGLAEVAAVLEGNCPGLLVELGRVEEALVRAVRLAVQLEASGDAFTRSDLRAAELATRLAQGKCEPSPAAADWLIETARASGLAEVNVLALGTAAAARLAAAEPEQARALLRELEQTPSAQQTPYYARQLPAMVRTALAAGDPTLARTLTNTLEPLFPCTSTPLQAPRPSWPKQSASTPGRNHLRRSRRTLGAVREHPRARPRPPRSGPLPLTLGDPAAKEPLRQATELFTSMGYRPALAEKEALIAQTTALAS